MTEETAAREQAEETAEAGEARGGQFHCQGPLLEQQTAGKANPEIVQTGIAERQKQHR